MKRKVSKRITDEDDEEPKIKRYSMSEHITFVVGTSSLTSQQQAKVSQLSEYSNVDMSGADFMNITHLVCHGGNAKEPCRRTLKVLFAIAQGAYLLNMDWVTRSIEMGYMVEESDYEMTKEQCPGAIKARRWKNQKKPGILDGLRIFVTGSTKMARDVLQQLLEAAGAKYVTKFKHCDICINGAEDQQEIETPVGYNGKPIVNEKVILLQ
jgi:NAD-dependent DNA ligase